MTFGSEYNYLNLPMKIVITKPNDAANSGSIEFVYDATGVKLRKTVKYSNGSVKETWDYVNGVEYKNQILQRVAHSEGAVVRNDFGQYQHEYVLRDHLGNTRVTFTDGVNKGEPYWDWSNYTYIAPDNTGYDDGVVTEADIKHINHTYPFGMAMEGNWNNAGNSNNNRYLYNGKQYNDDFGMGWYDYGARFYDPSIARWSAIDPLAEKYQRWSPYTYCLNNPVKFIDPDGMQIGEIANGKPMNVGTKAMTEEERSQARVEAKQRQQEMAQMEHDHLIPKDANIRNLFAVSGVTTNSKSKKSSKEKDGKGGDPDNPTISVEKKICAKSLTLQGKAGGVQLCNLKDFNLGIKIEGKIRDVPINGLTITCRNNASPEQVASYFTGIVDLVQKIANVYESYGAMIDEDFNAEITTHFETFFNNGCGTTASGTGKVMVGMTYVAKTNGDFIQPKIANGECLK
jgi:RHS repeat-associated protein